MKLLRVGEHGKEIPAILDNQNNFRNLSNIITDFTPENLNFENLDKIKKLNLNTGNINEYYKLSHKLGIPQTNTIKLQNKIFGIECNLEALNGIDFKKGCYVGQENTARIKLKNKLSKKLFPIKFEGIKINSDDIITKNNKEIGKVLIDGEYPFAVFKINDINFSLDQIYDCSTSKVKIIKTEI